MVRPRIDHVGPMNRPDVIIAGGGVIGLMSGWMLARAGVAVTVVDAGLPSATNAAAGMLAPSFERSLHKASDDLVAFSVNSLARWPAVAALLKERTGVDCDLQKGVLSVAFDEREAAAFEQDEEGGDRLTREEVLSLEPRIAPTLLSGRLAAEDGQVDPRLVRSALIDALIQDGGRILRGKSVEEIRLGARDGSILSVLSGGERLCAAHIIVATGARLPRAAAPLLPAGAIFPVKGEALALVGGLGPRRVVRTSRAYLCPKADGRVVIGATEIAHDWSLNPDEARVGALRNGAEHAFPSLGDAVEIDRWAGLRPATRDDAPIIGPAQNAPGVILALGHYRNGILLAPATADAVRRLVTEGGEPAIAAFSAARFNKLGVS